MNAYLGSNRRALHLVQQSANLLEVLEVGTIWVESALAAYTGRQRIDEKFLSAARVNLEVKLASDRVLPRLKISVSVEPTTMS